MQQHRRFGRRHSLSIVSSLREPSTARKVFLSTFAHLQVCVLPMPVLVKAFLSTFAPMPCRLFTRNRFVRRAWDELLNLELEGVVLRRAGSVSGISEEDRPFCQALPRTGVLVEVELRMTLEEAGKETEGVQPPEPPEPRPPARAPVPNVPDVVADENEHDCPLAYFRSIAA